jgi:hypothetical protein
MEIKCKNIISSNTFMWEEKMTMDKKLGMMPNFGIRRTTSWKAKLKEWYTKIRKNIQLRMI